MRNLLLFSLLRFCVLCLDELNTQDFCVSFDYVFLQDFKSSIKINFILREFKSFHFFPLLGLKKKKKAM